jgi:mitogen-activated protein kinase kinase
MSLPKRTKRNFRDLQLPVVSIADGEPIPTRLAPAGPRQRPPPLRDHGGANGLQLAAPAADTPQLTSIQTSLSSKIAALDQKPQFKEFDLQNDDFTSLQELGQGNGGSVMKVQHVPTGTIMAKKVRTVFHSTAASGAADDGTDRVDRREAR